MGKTVVVFTCAHTKPEVDNIRFSLLGEFLYDLKPDMVINLGDFWDMASLNSYDTRYPKMVVAQNYQADIDQGNDAHERVWHKFKTNKRKMPVRIFFEGNHEHRLDRAIALDPRIEGERFGLSKKHFHLDYWYDEYHEYENGAPKLHMYDGVLYGHYLAAGASGKAMENKHHASALLDRMAVSTTVGHSHRLDYKKKADAFPSAINGLVAGCFKGADETWAGQSNRAWSKGVAVKHNLDNGDYDFEWVSMERLEKAYG